MSEIRIDQSHCNYWLAQTLATDGWQIIFRDAGRVSRGGGGTQGQCLRVFEENSLPIPDIVAVSTATALLIEIDSVFSKAKPSFATYRIRQQLILQALNTLIPAGKSTPSLKLGFCKMGLSRLKDCDSLTKLLSSAGIDLLINFHSAKEAKLSWITSA